MLELSLQSSLHQENTSVLVKQRLLLTHMFLKFSRGAAFENANIWDGCSGHFPELFRGRCPNESMWGRLLQNLHVMSFLLYSTQTTALQLLWTRLTQIMSCCFFITCKSKLQKMSRQNVFIPKVDGRRLMPKSVFLLLKTQLGLKNPRKTNN